MQQNDDGVPEMVQLSQWALAAQSQTLLQL